MRDYLSRLTGVLTTTAKHLHPQAPEAALERPKSAGHGDFSCALPLQLARHLQRNPREVAPILMDAVRADAALMAGLANIELAGAGFINFTLAASLKQAVVAAVHALGEAYGCEPVGSAGHVLVEFVSANPTGPLHVGHGRQGALGDGQQPVAEGDPKMRGLCIATPP